MGIEISGRAWSSDPARPSDDRRRGLETDGRTELLRLLERYEPHRVIHSGPTSCGYSSTGEASAEGEHVCLDTGCEEGDLERAVCDGSRLAYQLIEALLGDDSAAVVVGVESMSVAGRFTIDEYVERHGSTSRTRSHDEVDVAGVEAKEDSPTSAVEYARPTFESPIPCKSPMVHVQPVGRGIGVGQVEDCIAR